MLESFPLAFKVTIVIYMLIFKIDGNRYAEKFRSPVTACSAWSFVEEPEIFRITYRVPMSFNEDRGDVHIEVLKCGMQTEEAK